MSARKKQKVKEPKTLTIKEGRLDDDSARVVVVHHPGGSPKVYWLMHLPTYQVIAFWKLKDQDKLKFLNKNCNRHHRLSRVQKGKNGKNISIVDIVSHGKYNNLIEMVSKYARVPENKVKTVHIQRFMRQMMPVIQRLFIDHDTGHLHNPETLEMIFNLIWLPAEDPIRFYAKDNSYPEFQPS